MSYFDNSTLLISARSPFARRVRVAFQEAGVKYSEKVLDVFQINPELDKHSPLGRVPILIMNDGNAIVDSDYILQAFYDVQKSPLMPFDREQKLKLLNLSGVASGAIEKVVEYFLEILKPSATQDESVKAECIDLLKKSLAYGDEKLGEKTYFLGETLTQADIDWVCFYDYTKLRAPFLLDGPYQKLQKHSQLLNERATFKATYPPPAK